VQAGWCDEDLELAKAVAPTFPRLLKLTLVSAVSLSTAFAARTKAQKAAISEFMSMEEEGKQLPNGEFPSDLIDRFEAEASVSCYAQVFNASTKQTFRTRTVTGHAHFLELNEVVNLRVDSPFDTIILTVRHKLVVPPNKQVAGLRRPNPSPSRVGSAQPTLSPLYGSDPACELDGLDYSCGGQGLALSGEAQCFALLPLDARFMTGRGCAVHLSKGSGERCLLDKPGRGGGRGGGGGGGGGPFSSSSAAEAEASQGLLELEATWAPLETAPKGLYPGHTPK